MKRLILPAILILVIAALLVLVGLLLRGNVNGLGILPKIVERTDVSAHTVVKEALPIGEYASLAYNYTSVVKDINALDVKGWVIPFTTRKYIFTFDGKIKLGIDGSRIRVEAPGAARSALAAIKDTDEPAIGAVDAAVQTAAKPAEDAAQETTVSDEAAPDGAGLPLVRVILPPIKILSHEIVDDSIEIFEQSQTIFNEIKIAEAFKVTAAKKREMEEKVMASDAVEDARASLEQQFGALLNALPGIKGNYELAFVWSQAEPSVP